MQAWLGQFLGDLPRLHLSNMENVIRPISKRIALRLASIFDVSVEKFIAEQAPSPRVPFDTADTLKSKLQGLKFQGMAGERPRGLLLPPSTGVATFLMVLSRDRSPWRLPSRAGARPGAHGGN